MENRGKRLRGTETTRAHTLANRLSQRNRGERPGGTETTGSAARQKEKEQILRKLGQSKYPEESKGYLDTLKKYDLTSKEAKRVEGILKKQSDIGS